MEVKINKEIRDYSEGVFMGLTLRQCFFSLLACISAVIVYLKYKDVLGMEVSSWLCMLSATPFAALGFIKYQGMNTEQIFVTVFRSIILMNRKLYYKPQNLYYVLLKQYSKDNRKDKKYVEKLRKNKKTKER